MNNKIDPRFIRASFSFTEKELADAGQTLSNYLKDQTEEQTFVEAFIQEGISNYNNVVRDTFEEVNNALQGNIGVGSLDELFPVSAGTNEAMSIMNSKATLFDTNQIRVELKTSAVNDFDKDEDDLERDMATFIEVFSQVLNDTYLKNPEIKFAITDAIRLSRGYPMAITLIGWDDNLVLGSTTNFKGGVTCENIPVQNFYWDASANNINDCEYVFIKKTLPYRKVANFLTGLKDKNFELLNAFYLTNSQQGQVNQNGSYFVSNNYLLQHGGLNLTILYRKIFNEDNSLKHIKIYYVVGDKYVIGTTILEGLTYLPFAILKEHSMPNTFMGISSVMMALPYIKQKYLIDGGCNNIVLNQKNPTYLIDQNSGIDGSTLLNWSAENNGQAIDCNGNIPGGVANAVHLVPSPQLQADVLQWRAIIEEEINKVISAGNENILNSKLSGAAIQTAVETDEIKTNSSVAELEKYLVGLVRIFLQFFKQNLPARSKTHQSLSFAIDEHKDSDAGYGVVDLDPKQFKFLEAEVVINADLLKTSRQQKQKQDLMELYQLELQYKGADTLSLLKDLVKEYDLPNKSAVLERMEAQEQEAIMSKAQQIVGLAMQSMQAKVMVQEAQQDPEMQEALGQNEELQQLASMDEEQLIQIAAGIIEDNGGNR